MTTITPIPHIFMLWNRTTPHHVVLSSNSGRPVTHWRIGYGGYDAVWCQKLGNKRRCSFCPVHWNSGWYPQAAGKKSDYPAAVITLKAHRKPTNRWSSWDCLLSPAQVEGMWVKKSHVSSHSKLSNLFSQGSRHMGQIQPISAVLCSNFWPTESVNNKMVAVLNNHILESLITPHK